MQSTPDHVNAVIEVLVSTLGIEDQASTIDASTPLFGELPELDSLGVVELASALEDRFDIEVADDDVTGEVFETVGNLADFVASKQLSGTS
ncbi:acyl carrier protein [Nocardioides alpinus]|uniref:Acyl carrier protein n=1 Tax=Nocardioides alpinus TaxID=748909 RepID=A0A1I0VSS2_9ACTN|nr:phosphopantetheine-binding protein [Nocardioides alpinus]PKH37435.1 acyl carrier protein [Nocardioides alpinus]SFA79013.1 acyl carrier protein [Nocardioides alpinus]